VTSPGLVGRPSEGPVLTVEHLAVSYLTRTVEVPAVVDVSFAIRPGESQGLAGESGCGKTTVALAVMRHLGLNGRLTRGRIVFEGQDMATLSASELRRVRGGRLAMVYQEPMSALNPCLTIGRQLAEVLVHHEGLSRRDARDRAAEMLSHVHLADPRAILRRYPHQLSGGQQQRIVIAMAMLTRPALLVLDEPTTALDVTVEAAVIDLIAELRIRYGTALLYISHNLGVMAKVCDRVGVMYAGEIVEEGTVREVFKRPRHPYTIGLLDCIPTLEADRATRRLVPIPGHVPAPHARPFGCVFGPRCSSFVAGQCDLHSIALEQSSDGSTHGVRCIRWREIERAPTGAGTVPGARSGPTDAALKVRDLDKYYEVGGSIWAAWLGRRAHPIRANEGLHFDVPRGQTLAIVGESGCGKSTFAKIVTGLETATAGGIIFGGRNIAMIPVRERSSELLLAIQIVFQNPEGTLNPSHTIRRAIGRVVKKFGLARGRRGIRAKVGELLDAVGLPVEFGDRKPRHLSGGQKQRIAVTRAFAGRPAVLVADEPVSALDVSVQAAIINLLTDMQAEHANTLIFISHDLALVRYLADEVVVMYLGRIMEAGPTDRVFRPPYHPYTEALLSAVSTPDPAAVGSQIRLTGELPSATDPPAGCRFSTRCPRHLGNICDTVPPPERVAALGHRIYCHIPLEELTRLETIAATPDGT
jgi:peptide/nickel transport system ATP-binding protein